MTRGKKAMLAAGLIAGAAALTGCVGRTTPAATPTPAASEQVTPEPQESQPAGETQAAESESGGGQAGDAQEAADGAPIPLRVGGREADAGALEEQGTLLLPIVETAELLGWKAGEESADGGEQERASIALEKEGSRISVTWVVSDNTIRQITWQRDGLLVPVDARLTSLGGVMYAPAAFFEAAMDASVAREGGAVEVTPKEPETTPETAGGGE